MGSLRFEGRRVETRDGDTIGSALFRDGVRTFNRSLKSHRRRGLYCATGDCANCLVTVDGLPGERACVTDARDGMRVQRETGWPSTERDALAINDRLHWAMPVGFYYKTFVRPRWLWGFAEKVIRRATGTGTLPATTGATPKPTRHARVDVLVIGGGVA
ncbi:MAG TPA: 2Fe-2S iron-sulfur cluster-binding protein, partial [Actinomycetota bacterium]|nr:2Fe-2S iron-sulfur cluster-binding protein [Actinomycetota bacterium]